METKPGMIVKSAAGRDKGKFMAVIAMDGDFVFLADGKERKLVSPKKKRIKHIRATKTVIDTDGLTDKGLRTLLRGFAEKEQSL